MYLHWTWLLVAVYEVQMAQGRFENRIWHAIEYLSLFAIVLLHEFGHALACRSVGGLADRIVLWPLGGVAVVNPPPRPGAVLWSIAAGPLVNVVLLVPTFVFMKLASGLSADVHRYAEALFVINLLLLVFNMLPIYPLDGGQIVQCLLWFIIGRRRSLMVASVIGLVVGVGLILPLLYLNQWWLALIAGFIALRSRMGIQQARILKQLESMPRHTELACPNCRTAPIKGAVCKCPKCGALFDVFESKGTCPACQTRISELVCINCLRPQPLAGWYPPPSAGD